MVSKPINDPIFECRRYLPERAARGPPAPTGVTAACRDGVLTVRWKRAGTGLSRATSYEPRVFSSGYGDRAESDFGLGRHSLGRAKEAETRIQR